MKTILRIICILLIASVVAAAFCLVVNSAASASGPGLVNRDGRSIGLDRPEGGDRAGGSITGGLPGVLATLAKLAGITILVLLIQKAFRLPGNARSISSQ